MDDTVVMDRPFFISFFFSFFDGSPNGIHIQKYELHLKYHHWGWWKRCHLLRSQSNDGFSIR